MATRKGGAGRGNVAPIDLDQVEKLAGLYCTDEDMAAFFGITREAFVRRKSKEPAILEAIERGKGKGRVSLRRAQFSKALAGHPTMLVWMGKQILGQKDTVDHQHSGEMTVTDGAQEKLLNKLATLAAARQAQQDDSGVIQ